jgi:hypothetical protein
MRERRRNGFPLALLVTIILWVIFLTIIRHIAWRMS